MQTPKVNIYHPDGLPVFFSSVTVSRMLSLMLLNVTVSRRLSLMLLNVTVSRRLSSH